MYKWNVLGCYIYLSIGIYLFNIQRADWMYMYHVDFIREKENSTRFFPSSIVRLFLMHQRNTVSKFSDTMPCRASIQIIKKTYTLTYRKYNESTWHFAHCCCMCCVYLKAHCATDVVVPCRIVTAAATAILINRQHFHIVHEKYDFPLFHYILHFRRTNENIFIRSKYQKWFSLTEIGLLKGRRYQIFR